MRRHTIESPIGRLILIAGDEGLTHVLFPADELSSIGLAEGEVPEQPHHPVLAVAAQQLAEYFNAQRTTFDVPLELHGNRFEREVWLMLPTIPYGQTMSYGEQAEAIGRPGAARAVGAADGRNPIPIFLPCHRVVGADGSLTGFGGGLELKRTLLELESGTQQLPF